MKQGRFHFGIRWSLTAILAIGALSCHHESFAQAQNGNQPPDTNAAPCVGCANDEETCSKDTDCCLNKDEQNPSVCLSNSGKCGPRLPTGNACGANNDCEQSYCDLGTCEPQTCDCGSNSCSGGYTCYQQHCVLDSQADGNDCTVGTACVPDQPGCATNNCVPPNCGGYEAWSDSLCACYTPTSPIIIDTDGTGFHLTSASAGITFDFFGDGNPIHIAWTAYGSTNGWLALDRNGNGRIDSAKELFGNITSQPASADPNGFLALAVFDLPENGGNGDGVIDHRDAIWARLLLWIDSNHDGISQNRELHKLDEFGIQSIGLMYVESRREDSHGNEYRYKGSLNPGLKGESKVVYDVILTNDGLSKSAPPPERVLN